MQGSGPKKRSRAQCIGWIHRNSRKSDRKKKHTELREELVFGGRRAPPSAPVAEWLGHQPLNRKVSARAGSNPVRRTLFSFLQHFLSFHLKVLGILLRFSQARAWVGFIETRTQSIIFNYIHWEEESPLANIDLPLRGLMLIRFSLPSVPLSLSLSFALCISLSGTAAHHWLYCFIYVFSTVGQLC